MKLAVSPEILLRSAVNAYDMYLGPGLADLTPMSSSILAEAPQRTLRRYRPTRRVRPDRPAVLLVPPLAAPANCFDLRRGCSMVEHFVGMGYPTYLVDYGPIHYENRDLGLEHWTDEVIPEAIKQVSRDTGGRPVQPVGWCLGGIMTLLAVAADPELPVASVAMVASPFDFTQVRMMAPVRRLAKLTGGALGTALYRTLGGAPAPLVSAGFRLTGIDRLVKKPIWLAEHMADRETLAHTQAIDSYMSGMLAYPGRTFGQLYHDFFRVNALANGVLSLGDREIKLADVKVPVLSVAGSADVLAPKAAVHHVGDILPNSPLVRLETAPGGHLGVLTGKSAVRTTWVYLDEFLAETAPKMAPLPGSARLVPKARA
ncbi:MAG: poly[(R)-3-hydroxyalkanoate] polymerase subunit PhaC [Thermoleophilaceae bacterium]|jgi:polyhydroxyalkanoate synthase|nr:poly[(R)-3-hydroxyalkanoate] polymerase subunit PhaC [Thermoleophilaceae bacterium]